MAVAWQGIAKTGVSAVATGLEVAGVFTAGISTIVGGLINAIVGLFGGGGGAPRSAKLAGYAQAGLATVQANVIKDLADAVKPYQVEEAKQKVELETAQIQAIKDKELIDVFSAGMQTAQAQAPEPFNWTPFLIGGGILGAVLIVRGRR